MVGLAIRARDAIGLFPVAAAIDYYIGPNGSDSNPGTEAQPWAITALTTKRATYAGRTVGFLDGTYDVSALNAPTRPFAVPLFNIAGGSALSPTIIKSVNPRGAHITAKTPGGTYTGSKSGGIFNGFHQPHEGGVFANTVGVTAGNIIFDGLRMSGEQTVLIRIGEGPNTGFGYANCAIINCELFDCNDAQANNNGGNYAADGANICPIQTFNTDNLLIENNYIHDIISWSPTTPDHLSCLICWYSRNTTIRYNTFVQASGIYGKEYPSPGFVCEYNYVQETRNTVGIADWVGGVSPIAATGLITYIRNNVINVAGGGIAMHATLGSGASRTPMKDPIYIHNNTVYALSPGNNPHIGFAVNSNIAGQSRSFNNIMFGGMNIFERKMHSFNPLAPGLVDYNWYPNTGSRWRLLSDSTYGPDSGGEHSSLATMAAAVQAAGGISTSLVEAHAVQSSQNTALMFTQTGTFANRFRLAATSSALNAGRSDGTTGGSVVDMGAWGNLPVGVTRIGCDFA